MTPPVGAPPDLGPARLRQVFGAFPTGVTVVAAVVDGVPIGLAAGSFTSVSLEPPLVSVSVAHTSSTWPRLRGASRLGISVLAAEQEDVAARFGARSGDRFAEVTWRTTGDGTVLLDGASAWLDCSVEAGHRAGDHDIVVLRVHDLDVDPDLAPLVFHASRYRRLGP